MMGWMLLLGMLTFGPLTWLCIYLLGKVTILEDYDSCLPIIVIPIAIWFALFLLDYLTKNPDLFR